MPFVSDVLTRVLQTLSLLYRSVPTTNRTVSSDTGSATLLAHSDYCEWFHRRCRQTPVQRLSSPTRIVTTVTTRSNHYQSLASGSANAVSGIEAGWSPIRANRRLETHPKRRNPYDRKPVRRRPRGISASKLFSPGADRQRLAHLIECESSAIWNRETLRRKICGRLSVAISRRTPESTFGCSVTAFHRTRRVSWF